MRWKKLHLRSTKSGKKQISIEPIWEISEIIMSGVGMFVANCYQSTFLNRI
jgi:hypothetical protein